MSGQALVVIPARWASSRLPGKALADLGGEAMVVRVARRAALGERVSAVVVATDDDRIEAAVRAAGVEVVRTSARHRSGTDRVAEVAARRSEERVINVQGDEPLIEPATIDAVIAALDDPAVSVATAASPLDPPATDPNRVKVVVDDRGRALYFSRAPIPHGGPYLLHHGLYAFRREALLRFPALPVGRLEGSERLEQLRLLEQGLAVQVVVVSSSSPSVDTPDDLEAIRRLFPPVSPPQTA